MSPLLSMRAPIRVNARLLDACAVTALIALVVALAAGTDRPTAAVPACLGVAAVCSALVAHLLFASARAISDARLLWMSVGVTIALAGLVGAGGVALLLYAALADAPLGDLAGPDGAYNATTRTLVGLIALAQLAVAFAWWRRADGAPTWAEMCVIALMICRASTRSATCSPRRPTRARGGPASRCAPVSSRFLPSAS